MNEHDHIVLVLDLFGDDGAEIARHEDDLAKGRDRLDDLRLDRRAKAARAGRDRL